MELLGTEICCEGGLKTSEIIVRRFREECSFLRNSSYTLENTPLVFVGGILRFHYPTDLEFESLKMSMGGNQDIRWAQEALCGQFDID